MDSPQQRQAYAGRIVLLGFGCIGQGVLPLLLRHIALRPTQLVILAADAEGSEQAVQAGIPHRVAALTASNYRRLLAPLLDPGDFLLNLSVDVSSVALLELCRERGALYLDACIEPWAGGYVDRHLPAAQRSNYALREAALALRRSDEPGPTAVLNHGANPGLVSHLVKMALLELAAGNGLAQPAPTSRRQWAQLARRLGVRVIHIAERDWQVDQQRKVPDEFVNTWSVPGFVSEALQPAELGWGSHERHFPADGHRHHYGSRAAIYLERPGAATRVRSWTPLAGPQHAFLITHGESISIADYLTLGAGDAPEYRPSVLYAYRPCDDTVLSLDELAGRNWQLQPRRRLLRDGLVSGVDELGVLLMGHAGGAYWYGSRLSVEQARALCPANSPTSLQVTVAVAAGVVWAMRNPQRGVVEPDELPFTEILDFCRPYLGEVVGVYSDWTPLQDRCRLFDEDLDADDPWQFKNFRVV
ncbi:homospermidine synthase [Geopseudomonas sagittaria]|uniref:Homospermidine synthase n=1 Tax=Geopseudomonas sagittaria TaxID=1135990 RepID=A0A1I5S1F5_9GAMM|nr:saccharopine dehydrogenase NADP-binding domain-containing protein [Pseudomonas sagittaria]SFP64361.1 homospermidine synthase [Pseudomonas sagittaria]